MNIILNSDVKVMTHCTGNISNMPGHNPSGPEDLSPFSSFIWFVTSNEEIGSSRTGIDTSVVNSDKAG